MQKNGFPKGISRAIVILEIVTFSIVTLVSLIALFYFAEELGWYPYVPWLLTPVVILVNYLPFCLVLGFAQLVNDVHAMRNKDCPNKEATSNSAKDKQQLASSNKAKSNANNSNKNNKTDASIYENNKEQFKYIDKACPKCGETVSFKESEMELICPWCNASISR